MEQCGLIFLLLLSFLAAFQCLNSHFEVITQSASIKKGSCIELTLRCKDELPGHPTNWIWMKDSNWNTLQNNFTGTVILSSNTKMWPVHSHFDGRVKSPGSLPMQWQVGTSWVVLICNLTIPDSGKYSFMYELTKDEALSWTEASAVVKVIENPCPIRFPKLPTMQEEAELKVWCFTTKGCSIQFLDDDLSNKLMEQDFAHMGVATLMGDWKNDGREVGCQARGNTDKYLRTYRTVNVNYSPKIIHVQLPQGVKYFQEGDDMNLFCTANGNPDPTFEWFKDNDSELLAEGGQLTVQSVRPKDNGKYKCVAKNDHGEASKTIDVDIKYPPSLDIEIQPSRTTFTLGEVMTLFCEVKSGNPQPDHFAWYKDDQLVASQQNYTVSAVRHEHMGRYTCVAFNTDFKNLKATAERLIDVEYIPRKTSLIIFGSTTMVKVGTSALLLCSADANPKPNEYVWSLSQDGISWDLLAQHTEEHLLLREVSPSQPPCYKCHAVNKFGAGEDSKPLCIQIIFRPTNLLLSMADKVPENQQVSVRCSVESLPLATLSLSRTAADQSSMQFVATKLSTEAQNNTLSYNFTATWADSGVYVCEAANSLGSEITHKTLEVTYSPKNVAVKASPSLAVMINQTLTLQCVADANPPIESVIWWKAGSVYRNVTETPTLTLTFVTLADAGDYACTAVNELGPAKSPPVKVEVDDGPSEPVLSMATRVTEGEPVSIFCSVESEPFSILTLTRVSNDLPSLCASSRVQNNTLSHTFTATWEDGGVYTCEADNGFRRRSSQRTLQVSYAPKEVAVRAQPSLMVTEENMLTLQCNALSSPPVHSVMWWKGNGSSYQNVSRGHTLIMMSVTLADAGLYGCTATNELGSARSPSVEVEVHHILKIAEAAATFDVAWFLEFIVPPICALIVLVLIVFFRKRSAQERKNREAQLSNIVAEEQMGELGTDNPFTMCNMTPGKVRRKSISQEGFTQLQLQLKTRRPHNWADGESDDGPCFL
ncbi:B-cell receptor CD22 isoform X2 [Syngnathus scovelli]|uniref:B-cell receptor CD22 isoform X2 n=1 Tax=Syngnathus scovelli TaxID=161590 RepID=UPI0021107146|nr:B-cell receptor CD22 isoform X2 [Syngnathus scovelli]